VRKGAPGHGGAAVPGEASPEDWVFLASQSEEELAEGDQHEGWEEVAREGDDHRCAKSLEPHVQATASPCAQSRIHEWLLSSPPPTSCPPLGDCRAPARHAVEFFELQKAAWVGLGPSAVPLWYPSCAAPLPGFTQGIPPCGYRGMPLAPLPPHPLPHVLDAVSAKAHVDVEAMIAQADVSEGRPQIDDAERVTGAPSDEDPGLVECLCGHLLGCKVESVA